MNTILKLVGAKKTPKKCLWNEISTKKKINENEVLAHEHNFNIGRSRKNTKKCLGNELKPLKKKTKLFICIWPDGTAKSKVIMYPLEIRG